MKFNFDAVAGAFSRAWRSRLGRLRTSTVVLIVAFVALFWIQQTYAPEPASTQTPPQMVPPGFVPDPEYTWVPRTNVQTPRTTTTTTVETTPETTTTSPEQTTVTTGPEGSPSPATPTTPTTPTTPSTPTAPQPNVVDPDGPGILPPITMPVPPGQSPQPQVEPAQPAQPPPSR